MKIRLTVNWSDFAIGISATWRSRLAFGFGPVLLGIYWGPVLWRCEECNKLTPGRFRAARAGKEKP